MNWSVGSREVLWQPPTDVYETAGEFIIRVEIAGVDPDEIEVSMVDRVLTVSGVRRDPEAKVGYHRMEILYGSFQTKVSIPRRVDASRVSAEYRNGFLTVSVPKADAVKVPVNGIDRAARGDPADQ